MFLRKRNKKNNVLAYSIKKKDYFFTIGAFKQFHTIFSYTSIKNYKTYQKVTIFYPSELCGELFIFFYLFIFYLFIYLFIYIYLFIFCEKALLFHFRQLSLYTTNTRASAAENHIQIVDFLNNNTHNELRDDSQMIVLHENGHFCLRSRMLKSVCTSMHSVFTFSFSRFKVANTTRIIISVCFRLFC